MRMILALLVFCVFATRGSAQPTLERAGGADRVAWYARPSDTGRYVGYHVGGGNPFRLTGQDRRTSEGTWGWDYHGFCWSARVMLDWYHGGKNQGYSGAYRTDGPRLNHAEK